MRKTNKNIQKIHRRPILVIVIILLIAVVGLIIAKILTNQAAQDTQPATEQPTLQEDQSDDTTSESASETAALGEAIEEGKTSTKQYEGEDPNTSTDYTGVVTYAGVTNGTLSIRVNIDQSLSSGTCELKLTNNGREYSESAPVILNASTSSCEGFDISTAELSSGTWSIEITINSNDKTGTITGSVNI